jgi:hypothetical protein
MHNKLFLTAFILLVFASSCGRLSPALQETSRQEFEKAYSQYTRYNHIMDTTAVTAATRRQLTRLIRQPYGEVADMIDIFKVGYIAATRQYAAIVVGITGELFMMLADENLHLTTTDEDRYNRLSFEYHAYAKTGWWAGEQWCEDAGEPPLDINIRKLEGNRLKTVYHLRNSALCFPHAWDAKSIEDLRQFIFWGPENTLYLKCYRRKKATTKRIPYGDGMESDYSRYVYFKIRIEP